jgi:hypothetical protein
LVAALEAPGHGGVIQRVLTIPSKRCQGLLIGFLPDRKSKRCLGR